MQVSKLFGTLAYRSLSACPEGERKLDRQQMGSRQLASVARLG